MIDFETSVVQRSHEVPVVVDFWAPWCGPCRILGPIIEELAARAAGRWELVKLNTDEQPEIASVYGVRGIPAVKLFHRGNVAAEFVGALPREQIARWLDENLPDPGRDRLVVLLENWLERDPGELIAELERLVAAKPEAAEPRLALARALVFDQPARAREMLPALRSHAELAEPVEELSSLVELAELRDPPPKLADGLTGAQQALRRRDLDAALEHLVDAAMVNKQFGNELARRAAVALFHLLGHHHELTLKHQRRLAMALHS